MDENKYFRSAEKTFWKKTMGREWTNLGIRWWLLKITAIIYFIQFIYFDFDWGMPFVEGFAVYVAVIIGYIFLSNDNKDYFYLQVSENAIEIFKNNTIQQNISVNDLLRIYIYNTTQQNISLNVLLKIYIFNASISNLISKKDIIKSGFKWTGASFQWVNNAKEKKIVKTTSFYLDTDEIVKLKKFIDTNELLKKK